LETYQVIPSQPIAKKELNTNKNTAAAIPVPVLTWEVVPARTASKLVGLSPMFGIGTKIRKYAPAMDMACPAAPNNMRPRRPNFSIVKMATHEAMKYSVPLSAASSRLRNPLNPMLFSKMVAA
jgi:hypothetical protein